MKKILSLALVGVMMFSALPMAYAADTVDVSEGTQVEVIGTKQSAYEIAVPAKMNPGQTGTVSVSGNWGAAETLTVTAPDSVELVNGDRSMEVGVTFAGITKAGHDVDAVEASADVTVAAVDTSTFFGTWTGLIEYTVDFDSSAVTEPDEVATITFTIDGAEYQAEEGMTWRQWIESDYNTAGFTEYEEAYRIITSDELKAVRKADGTNEVVLSIQAIESGAYELITHNTTN